MMFSRRQFLTLSASAGVAVIALGVLPKFADGQALEPKDSPIGTFEVQHTEAQWRVMLNEDQYRVLRHEDTERPYSSPLNEEHRDGTFACAGCALPLFSSSTKFDSHTGWPSFWAPLDNATAIRTDTSFGMTRKEVHCRRCGGHLGHVFDDGPKPTGLRYCMNGLAMKFEKVAA